MPLRWLAKVPKTNCARVQAVLLAKLQNPQTIVYCQYYTGYLPLDYMIDLRFLKFLTKTANTTIVFLKLLFSLNGNASIINVCAKYQATKKDISSVENAMWNSFIHENKLNI